MTFQLSSKLTMLTLALGSLLSVELKADFFYADSVSTTGGEFNGSFAVSNLLDEGLTAGTDTISTTVAFGDALSYATTSGPQGGYPVTLTFDFDDTVEVTAFHLWNNVVAGGQDQRGVRDFILTFYDGVGGSGSTVGSAFSSTATAAPTSGNFAAQTFNVGTRTGVRSVQMTIANNIEQSTIFVGAREMAFEGTPPPPPTTALGRVFDDHMVLQRGENVKIFGTDQQNLGSQSITVEFAGQTKVTTTDAQGNWEVTLDPMTANATGQNLTVTGSDVVTLTDVLIGEVWIAAGQSNMDWKINQISAAPHPATFPLIRMCNWTQTVDTSGGSSYGSAEFDRLNPEDFYEGTWQVTDATTVENQSAVAYFYAHNLAVDLNVPIGIVELAYGGTSTESFIDPAAFTGDATLENTFKRPHLTRAMGSYLGPRIFTEVYAGDVNSGNYTHTDPTKPHPHPFAPGFLFYAGISHLTDFTFKGAIWYQGESNTVITSGNYSVNGNRHVEYQSMLIKKVISSWRSAFGKPSLPFYMVQLPRIEGAARAKWPYYREAQRKVADEVENCELAMIMEFGDNGSNIHPSDKEPVGERLAAIARAKLYGDTISYSGPVYRGFTISGNKIILNFDHTDGGLVDTDGGALEGFLISGIERNFVPATAVIVGNTVEVSAASIDNPVAVRHAWTQDADVDLYNGNGFSSSSFRTDRWIEAPNRALRVACIGDSITAGLTISNSADYYPAQLANILGTTNFEVQNFGRSGFGFYRPGRQYKNTTQFTSAINWQPDVVICNLGVNDLPDFGSYTQDQFETEYFNIIDSFARSGNAPLILQWNKLAPLYPGHTQGNDADVPTLNEWIKQAAANTNAVTFDMEAPLSGHADWFPDNVHPNATGAREIAETTFCELAKYGDFDSKPEISEILSINTTGLQDENADYSDWIEITNNGTTGACLSNHYLTEDLTNLGKWKFPESTVLEPGASMTVFASAKNRAVNAAELHTNFTLPDNGGNLALVDTDAATILDSLTNIPAQHANVSYGYSTAGDSAVAGAGSSLTYHVPADGALGTSWTATSFDDASWTSGTAGVGYTTGNSTTFAGSQIWNTSFQNGWNEFGGATKALNGATLQYNVTGSGAALNGSLSSLNGVAWSAIRAGDWTVEMNIKVNDSPNGFALWFGTGTNRVTVHLFNDRTTSQSGSFTALHTNNDGNFHRFSITHDSAAGKYHIWRDGVQLTPAGGLDYDFTGSENRLLLGDYTGLAFGDDFDVEFSSFSYSNTLYTPMVETDVKSAMQGVNPSVYVRVPFTIAGDPAELTTLSLDMNYDDGFVAYLNGVEVASRNAPASPAWNAAASSDRADTAALSAEAIDLIAQKGNLVSGSNVLAIHALNSATSASRFVVNPTLHISSPSNLLFFETPTPNGQNGNAAAGSKPFAQWQSVFGINEQSADDGDGLSPLMEFVTGTSPVDSGSAAYPVPSVTENNGDEYLTMSFRVANGLPGLSYTLEYSDDLITAPIWESDPSAVMTSTVDNGDGTSTVTYRFSVAKGTEPHQFGRVIYSYNE